MTTLGKTLFSIAAAGALASVWFAVRSGSAEPRTAKVQTAQLTPSQRAELVQPPPAPKIEPAPIKHDPPPDEDPPEDGNGS